MATCYCKDSGQVLTQARDECGAATPCRSPKSGEFVQCCAGNSSCGADGFCFYDVPASDTTTGYYMGGCTDPTFKDPSCPQQCTDVLKQDVVWLPDQQVWACCMNSNETSNCSNPGDETFHAPSPDQLSFTSPAAAAAVSATPTASVSSSPSATAAPAAAGQQAAGTPASTIALATVLGIVVLLIAGLAFVLWRWHQRARSMQYVYQPKGERWSVQQGAEATPTLERGEVGDGAAWAELRAEKPRPSELDCS